MFILRKLFFDESNQSSEFNTIIGESYNTVAEYNKGWDKLYKDWNALNEKIYMFIVYSDGSKVMPLYKGQGNYIMTSDGKTFSNLTYKK